MKTKSIFTILLILSCLIAPVLAETAAEKLERAWAAEDSEQACELYAIGIWETDQDGGEELLKQIVRKQLKFQLVREHKNKNRVVAVYDVWRKGRKVDRVFTFFVDDKVWAHTENERHTVYFFEGSVSPRMALSQFPDTPELSELGRQYLKGESTGNVQIDGVLRESNFAFGSSHLFGQFGRALIVYGDMEYGVILELEDETWKVIDFTYGPNAKDMLLELTESHRILAK